MVLAIYPFFAYLPLTCLWLQSMPHARLTKSVVDKLTSTDREMVVWDEALPGFGIRVKPSGAKSYVVQYRTRDTGASRRKTVGRYGPLMTLHEAREQARGLLADAARGADPVKDAKARRQSKTVADLADAYLTEHAIPKKRPRSVRNDRAMLTNHVVRVLGARPVRDVNRREIASLHASLKATPYQANRVLSLLSKMFALAVDWEWRADNPARGVQRFHEEKRYRWLSDTELARLWAELSKHSNRIAANAIKLQLLTGARIGEVLSLEWSNLDLERGVWTKPSHHTKQKRTEHLPLSIASIALLRDMQDAAPTGHLFVFPGRKPSAPLTELKAFWMQVTTAAGLENYRIHDNRHTHASHLVSDGLSLEVVGRLLGHTNPSTTRRYAHLADEPLRAAADSFASKIEGG